MRDNTIGKLIMFLRLSKDMSQKEFAKKTDISPNYLSQIENGKRTPTRKYLDTAAGVLGVSTDLFSLHDIQLSGFKSPESKKLAKKINTDLQNIKKMIIQEMVSSTV